MWSVKVVSSHSTKHISSSALLRQEKLGWLYSCIARAGYTPGLHHIHYTHTHTHTRPCTDTEKSLGKEYWSLPSNCWNKSISYMWVTALRLRWSCWLELGRPVGGEPLHCFQGAKKVDEVEVVTPSVTLCSDSPPHALLLHHWHGPCAILYCCSTSLHNIFPS